jgi:putative flavoprotein involved in K+ transport
MARDRVGTLVIGGGQAGISVGYFLSRNGEDFRIVDAGNGIGHTWRNRWDSLRLFTEAKYDNLPGMRFPGDPNHVPGKDEMVDFLRRYVDRFGLEVDLGVIVDEVDRTGDKYIVTSGDRQYVADRVVVATGPTGAPSVPAFAGELAADITQVHSSDYRNPSGLPDGPALVVGAGNSGAEIAVELAAGREVWLSGRDVGRLPFRLGGPLYQVMNRLLTRRTPMGRGIAARTAGAGTPLVRLAADDVTGAGVRRVERIQDVVDGRPRTADGTVLRPASIVWCTGFARDHTWIKLPVFDEHGEPSHHRGVVTGEPGLYFVGLPYLHTMASSLIMGVTRDAHHIVTVINRRR